MKIISRHLLAVFGLFVMMFSSMIVFAETATDTRIDSQTQGEKGEVKAINLEPVRGTTVQKEDLTQISLMLYQGDTCSVNYKNYLLNTETCYSPFQGLDQSWKSVMLHYSSTFELLDIAYFEDSSCSRPLGGLEIDMPSGCCLYSCGLSMQGEWSVSQ